MSTKLKALEILKHVRQNNGGSIVLGTSMYQEEVDNAIKELEEYEQNFKQKEFNFRTECQDIISAGRVEAENMPDRLAELEKVILHHYLGQGYEIGVGGWKFKLEIDSDYKSKVLKVWFCEGGELPYLKDFLIKEETTKEMFDKAIAHFTTNQNTVVEEN